jgi:hypothetical protein
MDDSHEKSHQRASVPTTDIGEINSPQISPSNFLDRLKSSKRIATRHDIRELQSGQNPSDAADLVFKEEMSLNLLEESFEPSLDISLSSPMICVHVIKAFDLSETLSDTNPFLVFDWGGLIIIIFYFSLTVLSIIPSPPLWFRAWDFSNSNNSKNHNAQI